MAEKVGSFKPEDAVSGGAIPTGPCTLTKARFVMYDYDGKFDDSFGLMIDVKTEDGDEANQFYSAGKDRHPTKDGKGFTGAPGLPKNSNAMAFIVSLLEAGFDGDKFDDGDISVIDGTRVVLKEEAQPKRKGAGKEGSTYALVESLIKGDGKAKSAKSAPNGQTKEVKKKSGGEHEDQTRWILEQLEGAKGKPVTKKALSQTAFRTLKGDERTAMIELLGDDDFLGGDDAPWNYDGTELELSN